MITKEDIIHWFEVLKNKCDRVTTGNCSHEINSIRFLASNWASKIKKEQGETMFYHNFIGISEVCTFLLIIVLIGYIMFKASIWLGVGYIMILIAIIISFIQTNRKILNI